MFELPKKWGNVKGRNVFSPSSNEVSSLSDDLVRTHPSSRVLCETHLDLDHSQIYCGRFLYVVRARLWLWRVSVHHRGWPPGHTWGLQGGADLGPHRRHPLAGCPLRAHPPASSLSSCRLSAPEGPQGLGTSGPTSQSTEMSHFEPFSFLHPWQALFKSTDW